MIYRIFCSVLFVFLLPCTLLATPLRIGLMCPLTGSWASEGQDMKNIVELLVEETNKAGGINGEPVELLIEDDGGEPRQAALAATRLSTQGISAVIGTYGSSVTEASQNIYAESEILQIATGSTAIRLSAKGLPLFFRTCPRDDDQAKMAVKTLQKLGFTRVALLHDNTSYARGLADETKKLLADTQTEIVFFDALTPGERDYNTTLTKIKAANPEIIFFTGYYPEVGMLLRQKMDMGWDVPLLGGDASNNPDLLKIAGNKAAAGYMFLSPPVPADLNTPESNHFLEAYKAAYKTTPGSIWAVVAADAYRVIAEAAQKTSSTDAAILANYLKTQMDNFPGLTGPLSFNDQGDRVGDLYRLYKVDESGAFVLQ